jgi:hypothetical protein
MAYQDAGSLDEHLLCSPSDLPLFQSTVYFVKVRQIVSRGTDHHVALPLVVTDFNPELLLIKYNLIT